MAGVKQADEVAVAMFPLILCFSRDDKGSIGIDHLQKAKSEWQSDTSRSHFFGCPTTQS